MSFPRDKYCPPSVFQCLLLELKVSTSANRDCSEMGCFSAFLKTSECRWRVTVRALEIPDAETAIRAL